MIGGNTDGTTENFIRGENGALMLLPASGMAAAEADFEQGRGVVYTGGRGGRIDSEISTADGVLYYGPGMVTVTGANSYSGGTLVQGGHLQVRNTEGSATGSDTVLVSRDGILSGDGTVEGDVELEGILVPGVFGTSGNVTPSTLSVGGSVLFQTDSILSWTLIDLTDSISGGTAGSDWSFLSVGGDLSFEEDSYLNLDFENVAGPESGNSFWDTTRYWSVASFGTLIDLSNLSIFGSNLEFGNFSLFEDSTSNTLGLAYSPNGGSILIPEPSSYVLILALASLCLVVVRRKF